MSPGRSAEFRGTIPKLRRQLPRRQVATRPVLRGLPHRAAQVRQDGSRRERVDSDVQVQRHLSSSATARSATSRIRFTTSTRAPVLAYKNYNYGGVLFNEVLYPQDIRNCTKCHDGSATSTATTAQGDNCKNVPSRLACGGCHDGIDFATGKGVTLADAAAGLTVSTQGHIGGIQPDDTQCAACHADPTRARHQHRRCPPAGDSAECPERAGGGRRERQHQRGLDRFQPGSAAGRGDHGHLRHQERLGERAASSR